MRICKVPIDVNHFLGNKSEGATIVSTAYLTRCLRLWVYHERHRLPSETKEQRSASIKAVLQTLSKFVNDVLDYEMQGSGFSSEQLVSNPDAVSATGRMALRAMQEQFEHSGGYHHYSKQIDDEYYDRNRNFFSGAMCGKGYEYEARELTWHGRSMSPAHLLILSISALGEALESAYNICYDDRIYINFKTPLFIKVLLQAAGWCPVEVKRLAESFSTGVLSYLTNFDRKDSWSKHQGCCPQDGCQAYQITDAAYKGRHVTADCECSYISVQEHVECLTDVIDNGHIPLIFLSNGADQDEPSMGLTAWGGDQWGESFPYVAISHVWADGIGNTEENAIPKCQLIKLQRLVSELYKDEEQPSPVVPFWIDTMMIPLDPAVRARAISSMDHVYLAADKVLVLDAFLESRSSKQDPQELMMAIYLCQWMTRLWTLQEAFLARQLFFRFAEDSFSIEQLAQMLRMRLLEEDLALLTETQSQAKAQDDVEGLTFDRALNTMLKARLAAYLQHEGRVTEEDDLHDLYPVRTFVMNRMLFLRINAWNEAKMAERHAAGDFSFSQMAIPMHYRASSKAEDEPLCLALLAGISVPGLMQVPPEERMEQMYGQFDEVCP